MRTLAIALLFATALHADDRPRLRDLGVTIGTMPTGPLNAITDVDGVRVGHTTIVRGENVRTGVTVILPHSDNLFQSKVPGAVYVGNGFGKIAGTTQVEELGEIETPILLTSTLSVPRVADAVIDYMLALPGNGEVRSINPLVAETNDGRLNDIRSRPIARDDVLNAIRNASSGAVAEGSVGAGTGTIAFGWKGGIGTASREAAGFTVGVLVQTNFGGDLTIGGTRIGNGGLKPAAPPGSCVIVVATNAPLDARNLKRLAKRAIMGFARAGASGDNGSGDYVIAFSTVNRIRHGTREPQTVTLFPNEAVSPLFLAAIEATEEAIVNSLLRATTVTGNGRTVEALPIERVKKALKSDHRLH
jgi:D-aminopeptidase